MNEVEKNRGLALEIRIMIDSISQNAQLAAGTDEAVQRVMISRNVYDMFDRSNLPLETRARILREYLEDREKKSDAPGLQKRINEAEAALWPGHVN